MRRILAGLVALLMTGAVAACSQPGPEEQPADVEAVAEASDLALPSADWEEAWDDPDVVIATVPTQMLASDAAEAAYRTTEPLQVELEPTNLTEAYEMLESVCDYLNAGEDAGLSYRETATSLGDQLGDELLSRPQSLMISAYSVRGVCPGLIDWMAESR